MTRYQLQLKQGDPGRRPRHAAKAAVRAGAAGGRRAGVAARRAAGNAAPAGGGRSVPHIGRRVRFAGFKRAAEGGAAAQRRPCTAGRGGAGGVCRYADRAGAHAGPGAVRPPPCPPKAPPRRTRTRTCARCGRSCSASWQPTRPLRRCWTTPAPAPPWSAWHNERSGKILMEFDGNREAARTASAVRAVRMQKGGGGAEVPRADMESAPTNNFMFWAKREGRGRPGGRRAGCPHPAGPLRRRERPGFEIAVVRRA